MKIIFQAQGNIQNIMRSCGYFSLPAATPLSGAEASHEMAFIRPLSSSGSGYPRFHAYVNLVKSDEVGAKQFNRVNMEKFPRETSLNLHLDQKKPIYRGVSAHSGEYEGELVEKEIARIKQILGPMVQR